jgi:hypothetical protein
VTTAEQGDWQDAHCEGALVSLEQVLRVAWNGLQALPAHS